MLWAAALLIVTGIVVGVVVWRVNTTNSASASASVISLGQSQSVLISTNSASTAPTSPTSTSSASSSSSTPAASRPSPSLSVIPGTAGVVLSNPADPSQFRKDSRLSKSFYGLAYTSLGVQVDVGCRPTLQKIFSCFHSTTRLHLYGSSCDQSQLVLQAIKVNMTVWLGVYIGDNQTVNNQQMSETISALKLYGTASVSGVTVGNEYILNAASQSKATLFLVAQMAQFRAELKAAGFSVPVGTADAGSVITKTLSNGADFIMSNDHPYFGGVAVADAAVWTYQFFQDNDVIVDGTAVSYIGETGWPTASLSVANATDGAAVAGIPQLGQFLATFPCQANSNGTKYFYFEAFDQPWQAIYGGVEPFWGLFDANKVLKNVALPTCISP